MITWNHWSETFDWENGFYFLRDSTGNRRGPFKGRRRTLREAEKLYAETENTIDIIEATHNYEVAAILDGQLILNDLHDDEGNRMSHRIPW